MTAGPRVVVVTGGGAGIGAGIAEELGRRGAFVVTMDPLVTLDGAEQLPVPEETTAGRIVAAGGSARASSASVTDATAVHDLFEELARSEHPAFVRSHEAVLLVEGFHAWTRDHRIEPRLVRRLQLAVCQLLDTMRARPRTRKPRR